MNPIDPLAPFMLPIERLALPYCITGSVAASVYGEPRLTADIDIVLVLKLADLGALRTAFPDADYWTERAVYLPFGMALDEEAAAQIADAVLGSRVPLDRVSRS